MRRLKTTTLLTIPLIILSISCERDKNDQQTIADKITLGDYSNMIVKRYDTILLAEYYNVEELDLDINRDSVNDIGLISGFWGGLPSTGWNPYSEVMSLNKNALILGYYRPDTLYLNRKTYLVAHPDNGFDRNEYYNYTCHRMDVSDTIQEIFLNSFKLSLKNKDNVITNSDTYNADSLKLMNDMYGQGPYPVGKAGDTNIIVYQVYYNDCYTFPSDEIKYIGLKIVDKEVAKLGWIKLGVSDKNKILLLESAIQE